MKKTMSIPLFATLATALFASSGVKASSDVACVDLDPKTYWNAEQLFKTPAWRANPYPESDYAGLKAMLVEGVGPKGSKAEFFAYYATPEGPAPKGGFPGMLLVHGGGGTAFPNYVQDFVKDGFAVLALDWYNQRPAPALTNVPPSEVTVPRVDLEGGRRQDHVANVSNMVLAHSLLRSFPEVNADRTVYVGLSWGSWYGSCVTAVDNRFKGACMIYLCDRHPQENVDEKAHRFVKGPFHKSMKVPSWWIVWSQEVNGLPSTLQAGWEACPCEVGRTILHNLGHSHSGFTAGAVHRMARAFVGLEPRLPRLSLGEMNGQTVSADILDRGTGLKEALLWYTAREPLAVCDMLKNRTTEWRSVPAKISGKKVTANLPADARIAYLSVYEASDAASRKTRCASSGFFHVPAADSKKSLR